MISVLLAVLLLIGGMVCLLLVSHRSVGLRLGTIILFTFMFAGVVGLLTNARRAEMFGSSAAYVVAFTQTEADLWIGTLRYWRYLSVTVTTVGVEYRIAPSGLVFRGMGQFEVDNEIEVF